MGIDRETALGHLNIVMDDTPQHIKAMRLQANEDSQNEEKDEVKKFSLTNEGYSFSIDEYYFDDNGDLSFSGEMTSKEGKVYVSFILPLSDTVLLDIISYCLKRLNKLKTVLETLK